MKIYSPLLTIYEMHRLLRFINTDDIVVFDNRIVDIITREINDAYKKSSDFLDFIKKRGGKRYTQNECILLILLYMKTQPLSYTDCRNLFGPYLRNVCRGIVYRMIYNIYTGDQERPQINKYKVSLISYMYWKGALLYGKK